jgi:hypothetical protein
MPTTDTPEAPTTLADDLRASYEQLTAEVPDDAPEVDSPEAPAAEDAAPSVESEPTEPKVDKTGRLHRPDGKFAPKAGEAPAAAAPAAKAVPKPALAPAATEAPAVVLKPDAQPPAAVVVKAPTSWRPETREKWASLPDDVKQDIQRREREISVGLGEAASHRKTAEGWTKTIAPYEMLFRADGTDPQQGVAGLLQVAATLISGPEPRKAEVLAGLFTRYGVTVDSFANAVNRLQAGGAQPAPQPTAALPPEVGEALAYVRQLKEERETEKRGASERMLEEYRNSGAPEAEFFEDLRKSAGRLLALAMEDGESMTLQEAFALAAARNSEISGVLAQRKAAAEAKTKAAEIARKRGAARSIQPFPSAPPPGEEGDTDGSLRGDLEMVTRKLASGGRT